MHEASIAASMVEITLKHAGENQLKSVSRLLVQVGGLHHVVPEVLQNYFELLREEHSILAGARLDVERLEVLVGCKECEKESTLEDVIFLCPNCGSASIEVLQGNEMHLMSIEGEK